MDCHDIHALLHCLFSQKFLCSYNNKRVSPIYRCAIVSLWCVVFVSSMLKFFFSLSSYLIFKIVS
jgi:hypothetical protein